MEKLILLYAFLFALFLSNITFAQSASFSTGNDLKLYNVFGDIVVTCESNNAHESQNFTCRDNIIEPSPYAYFLGAKGNGADSVQLVSNRNDGSTRTKTLSYNEGIGKSTELANLWVSTLLQRPLLKEGLNIVDYTYYKGSQPLNSGRFNVQVSFSGSRNCQKSYYTSKDINDCRSPYSVCQRYFEQFNWCK